jgi:hypothetical protein
VVRREDKRREAGDGIIDGAPIKDETALVDESGFSIAQSVAGAIDLSGTVRPYLGPVHPGTTVGGAAPGRREPPATGRHRRDAGALAEPVE